VTPKIAEKVAVAQSVGTLNLVLRSLSDNSEELERAIASSDVNIPANATPEQEERLLKAALNRPIDRGASFSTGGDVSRFQRSTPPPQRDRSSRQESAGAQTDGAQPQAGAAPAPTGPTVRVSRGKETVEVPLSKNAR